MKMIINQKFSLSEKENTCVLANDNTILKYYDQAHSEYLIAEKSKGKSIIELVNITEKVKNWVVFLPGKVDTSEEKEQVRLLGKEMTDILKREKCDILQLTGTETNSTSLFLFLEGLVLSYYSFDKYKTLATGKLPALVIDLIFESVKKEDITDFSNLMEAIYLTRDLVNEPASYLTAEELSQIISNMGNAAGFKVEILGLKQIQALKMGGLLSVNKGSPNPPTFTILEYKPEYKALGKPIVLVGKGVVFDTGGLSLKTAEGMEYMKADMAGAATVAGIFYAVAKNQLPVHLIGLIPATENRPGGEAMAPGDIIKMMNGSTVEVLNTDAEGRLILADALCYAKKYNPRLVIDMATLTGAAARAVGKEAMVMMANAPEKVKIKLSQSGFDVYERIVEFPLWKEYFQQLKSEVADIKNIGSSEAGAITAGKFLEYFTDYDWIHLDIAGVAFLNAESGYRVRHATGTGVRLIYNYIKNYLV